jgi:hypothetical protein
MQMERSTPYTIRATFSVLHLDRTEELRTRPPTHQRPAEHVPGLASPRVPQAEVLDPAMTWPVITATPWHKLAMGRLARSRHGQQVIPTTAATHAGLSEPHHLALVPLRTRRTARLTVITTTPNLDIATTNAEGL